MYTLNKTLIATAVAAATLLPVAGHALPTFGEPDSGFNWRTLFAAGRDAAPVAPVSAPAPELAAAPVGTEIEAAPPVADEAVAAEETLLAMYDGAADSLVAAGERRTALDTLDDLVQGITLSYPFRSGSDRIEPHVAEQLAGLADTLSRLPQVSVQVEGYTDVRGGERSNRGLSERRANAVAVALTEAGVDAGRVLVRSYGEAQAVAAADDAEGWFFDRRAVVSFLVEE